MAVNGIQLAIGQRWKTRGGEVVEIVYVDDDCKYPWVLSSGESVNNEGCIWDDYAFDGGDLITLIQDEHGFIPWNGGECPVGYGVEVEVKFSCGKIYKEPAGNFYWGGTLDSSDADIIAYRVVKQTEQTKEVVVETKTEAQEEPKYTVDEVFAALDKMSPQSEHWDYYSDVVNHLAKTQDPDYKLYLELKAKFE